MTDHYTFPITLACTLGSLAVHIEEMLDNTDPATILFDRAAIRTLLGNPELREWIDEMGAMLPQKRT